MSVKEFRLGSAYAASLLKIRAAGYARGTHLIRSLANKEMIEWNKVDLVVVLTSKGEAFLRDWGK